VQSSVSLVSVCIGLYRYRYTDTSETSETSRSWQKRGMGIVSFKITYP